MTFARRVALPLALVAAGLSVPSVAVAADGPSGEPGRLAAVLQHLPVAAGAPNADTLVHGTAGYQVSIRVKRLDGQVMDLLRAAGAVLGSRFPASRTIEATVPAALLGAVAAVPGVEYVGQVERPVTSGAASTNSTGCGSVQSEADTQLRSEFARSLYGVDGAGIKIAAISDSYNVSTANGAIKAPADVASGDLPGGGNPCGHASNVNVLTEGTSTDGDEGRAMLQLLHDIAPGAQLSFANSGNTELEMADHIRQLAAQGNRIIVDDMTFFREAAYQSGPIEEAVDEVVAQGVTYLSSASNSNTKTTSGQTVGSWSAPAYRPAPCPAGIAALDCMDFDPGAGVVTSFDTTRTGGGLVTVLKWAEPESGVATEFDLYYRYVSSGSPVTYTTGEVNAGPSGSQKASESVSHNYSGAASFIIARKSGTAVPPILLQFISNGSSSSFSSFPFPTSSGGDIVGPAIVGHNGAAGAITVAAVPYDDPTTVESFSSMGPTVRHYFGPVSGTTPAGASSRPPLPKPDLSATDGVANTFFPASTHRFYGTSAAAPDAAAVAALALQKHPTWTPAQIRTALVDSARPVGTVTPAFAGAGLIDAVTAIGSVPSKPAAPTAVRGNQQAVVSWAAPSSNGGAAVTGYQIRETADDGATWSDPIDAAASPLTVTGLVNGTSYRFQVAAINGVGASLWSSSSASVVPATVPGVPTAVTPVAAGASAKVSWTAPASNGGSAVTGYRLRYSSNSGSTWSPPMSVTSPATVNGLSNGTPYVFQVAAVNGAGQGAWSSTSASVTPLPAPTSVAALSNPSLAFPVKVDAGHTYTFTGRIVNNGAPVSGATVKVMIRKLGLTEWGTHGTAVSDANGNLSYTFTPTKNAQLMWQFDGSTAYAASNSAAALREINVKPTMTMAATKTTITVGSTTTFWGVMTPGLSGETVTLQKVVNGVGTNLTVTATVKKQVLPNGKTDYGFIMPFKPTAKGAVLYRVITPKDNNYMATTSGGVWLTVK